jgi:hypothetical protein
MPPRAPILVLLLVGCSSAQPAREGSAACRADTAHDAAVVSRLERRKASCSADAARAPGRGGIQADACGVYAVSAGPPLWLHHAWSATACTLPETIPDRWRWWSPTDPVRVGLRCYRSLAVLCEEWGTYDCVLHCRAREGALIEIGPGAGVACAAGPKPGSEALQVHVPDPQAALTDCSVERNQGHTPISGSEMSACP